MQKERLQSFRSAAATCPATNPDYTSAMVELTRLVC